MVYALLSSILLILSFPLFNLSFLAWVAFVPLFINARRSRKKNFLLFYLTGVIFWAGVLYWIVYVSLLGYIVLTLYLAVYFALFGLGIYSPQENLKEEFLYILFLSSLWVSLEFIRAHLFTGFPWALLGYSQYRNLLLIQTSDISGTYGVSFLLIAVNVGISRFLLGLKRKKRVYLLSPIFASLLLLATLVYGYQRLRYISQLKPSRSVVVSVIQGNISPQEKWDGEFKKRIIYRYLSLTKKALRRGEVDLVVWPETAVPCYFYQDKEAQGKILSLSSHIRSFLLIGTVVREGEKIFNSALFISKGRVIERYDKLHLVPFGEYVPSLFAFVRNFFEIGNFSAGKEWRIFSSSQINLLPPFSTLICFEDIFPYLSRGFVRKGARFLINISNDAWFGKSSAPYQHLQCAVFRAIENRVNLIKCSNTGISCFIAPTGRIVGTLSSAGKDIFIEGYYTQKIEIKKAGSFYTHFGDIFAFSCLLFCSGFGIIKFRVIKRGS
ncbi:MAG: apolipoprotein N-acyltransferase [Candidatus Omnitrophota bacterium]|nr:MAG: apolipoprotein N-acyltransferase [Candidatus Omnitrophota bacterium]